MNLKRRLLFSSIILVLANGCSSYSTDDYGDPHAKKNESKC